MGQVATTNVVEVTDENFEQVVIEGSKERPVVVDLWASWCAPCRTLGPILEKVAEERKGGFLLAKVDVDAQGVGQALLQAVKSQGIPTVVGFREGAAVDMMEECSEAVEPPDDGTVNRDGPGSQVGQGDEAGQGGQSDEGDEGRKGVEALEAVRQAEHLRPPRALLQ